MVMGAEGLGGGLSYLLSAAWTSLKHTWQGSLEQGHLGIVRAAWRVGL